MKLEKKITVCYHELHSGKKAIEAARICGAYGLVGRFVLSRVYGSAMESLPEIQRICLDQDMEFVLIEDLSELRDLLENPRIIGFMRKRISDVKNADFRELAKSISNSSKDVVLAFSGSEIGFSIREARILDERYTLPIEDPGDIPLIAIVLDEIWGALRDASKSTQGSARSS